MDEQSRLIENKVKSGLRRRNVIAVNAAAAAPDAATAADLTAATAAAAAPSLPGSLFKKEMNSSAHKAV